MRDADIIHSHELRFIPKHQMLRHFIIYTYQIYILKLPANEITEWSPDVVNTLMEMYIDQLRYNSQPLPNDTNSRLIDYAIQQHWTVAQLVWTAIALRQNAMPVIWSAIHMSLETSTSTGDYGWRMPIPLNRNIRPVSVVALPSNWY